MFENLLFKCFMIMLYNILLSILKWCLLSCVNVKSDNSILGKVSNKCLGHLRESTVLCLRIERYTTYVF